MRVTAVLLLVLIGCATVEVESYNQTETLEPSSAGEVEVFANEGVVKRPYRRIGALHWNARNPGDGAVRAALKEQAATMGANGVILTGGDVIVTGPFFWPVAHHSGFAEAIRLE